MILAPYSTDAPIYHLPIATVGIIVANVVIFGLTTLQLMLGNVEVESIEWLILNFDTINPLQWITSAFMHGGPMHLIGNMIFLWSFGLVVEGKIGGPRFATLYLIITLLDGACGQIPMFLMGGEGGALGASGVIFALMMIAVIWAPENDMDCFYMVFLYFGTFEISLVKLGGIFILLQVVFLALGGFTMSSEMLHMIGILIGAPIGFFMLRQDMVDCEGWDLVSRNEFLQEYDFLVSPKQRQRMKQKEQSMVDPVTAALGYTRPMSAKAPATVYPQASTTDESLPATTTDAGARAGAKTSKARRGLAKVQGLFEPNRVKKQQQKRATTQRPTQTTHPDFNRLSFAFRQSLDAASTATATQTFQRMDQMKLAVGLADKSLLRYVSLLGKARKWVDAMRPLQIIVAHQGDLADDARLRIAQIQLSILKEPALALQTLGEMSNQTDRPGETQKKHVELKKRLITAARKAIG